MKIQITLVFLFCTHVIFGQIPPKEDILKGYYIGNEVFGVLQNIESENIQKYFKDTTNLNLIMDGFQTGKFDKDSIEIRKDVMYDQVTNKYEFLVYGGIWIPADDNWGLYDYHFVILIEIDISEEKIEDQIVSTRILNDSEKDKLKGWWQSYMSSYKARRYARNEIAKAYNLIPPPPPPPETEKWF